MVYLDLGGKICFSSLSTETSYGVTAKTNITRTGTVVFLHIGLSCSENGMDVGELAKNKFILNGNLSV